MHYYSSLLVWQHGVFQTSLVILNVMQVNPRDQLVTTVTIEIVNRKNAKHSHRQSLPQGSKLLY